MGLIEALPRLAARLTQAGPTAAPGTPAANLPPRNSPLPRIAPNASAAPPPQMTGKPPKMPRHARFSACPDSRRPARLPARAVSLL